MNARALHRIEWNGIDCVRAKEGATFRKYKMHCIYLKHFRKIMH